MIDIALFGLGRIGIMHGKNLMRNREFNLKYIYDIDKNLSKKYSKILKSIAVNSPSEIFKDNRSVFTFSMHSKTNYPAKKSNSDLDVELEDNLEDDAYIKKLKHYLIKLSE